MPLEQYLLPLAYTNLMALREDLRSQIGRNIWNDLDHELWEELRKEGLKSKLWQELRLIWYP